MNPGINISTEEYEQIDGWLNQQLPEEERVEFEKRLATDAAWMDKMKEVRLLVTGIQDYSMRDALQRFHQSFPAERNRARLVPLRVAAIAASLFVVFIAGWLLLRPSGDSRLFETYFQPDPGLSTAMSLSDNYAFDKAMVDYKSHHYTSAARSWTTLLSSNPGSDTLNYFIAMAYLADGKPDSSLRFLDAVIANRKPAFLKDAYWYNGLALLKLNRRKDAIPFIQQSDHQQKVSLLEKLR